jgi:hypothetical protein
MKKIKFATNHEAEGLDRMTKTATVTFDRTAASKDKLVCSDKDLRRKIAEVASDLWGKMGSFKVIINEVKALETPNVFDISFPRSQENRVGFLLFFITEVNEKRVRVRFAPKSVAEATV